MVTDNIHKTTSQMEQIVESLRPLSSSANTDSFLRAYVPTDGMIRIINNNNSIIFTSTKNAEYAEIKTQFTNNQTERIVNKNKTYFAVTTIPVIWHTGDVVTLELTENIQSTFAILQILRFILVTASIIIIIPTFFAGRLLANIILNPIQSLIITMEEIRENGELKNIVLKETKKDEIYQLGTTFNNMISILKRQFNQQKQFVSDASHELKTPLTVIESYANMLKRWGMKREDVLQEAVEAIHSESIRMKEMTNQMLELAKDDGGWKGDRNHLNLLTICQQSARKMEMTYNRKILVKNDEENIWMYGDEKQIKQVLFILLDNAIKYSSDIINLNVKKSNTSVLVEVADKGIGINLEEQDLIFERFYRVDKARNREMGGTGLGLAIAKKIMESHKGTIEVKSDIGKGTKIICQFPVNNTHKGEMKNE